MPAADETVLLGLDVAEKAPILDESAVPAAESDELKMPNPVLVADGGGVKLVVNMPVRLPVAVVLSLIFVGSSVGRLEYPADANTAVMKLRNPIVSDKKKEYGRSVTLTVRSLRMVLMSAGRELIGKCGEIVLRSL